MGLNQYGLGVLFTGKDTATPVVNRVGHSLESTTLKAKTMRGQFARTGMDVAKGMAMMAGGLKALGGLNRMVMEFAGFQSVVTSAAAIAGASASGYNKLYKAAERAGIETMFSPRQAALGLRVLSQAGLNVQDSMKALLPTLNLATASFGELGPEQTAGLVTIAMKTFGIAADDVSAAVGRMVHASNTAKMSIGDLQLGLAGASRGSLALKQSLSETLISLGMIKNAGFRTTRAATQLSMAMARIATPQSQKLLKKYGVTVADAEGRFRPFLDVVQDVTVATANMTDKKKAAYLQDVFGMEALGGLLAVMNQLTKGIKTSTGETVRGTAAIAHMRRGMAGAGQTANVMSTKYLATMEGQFKLMKGSIDTLKIAIGSVFVKTFLPVVQAITGAVNRMIKAVGALPGPIKELIGTMAPLAAAAVTVAGLVRAFKGMLGMMIAARGAMSAMGAATTGSNLAGDVMLKQMKDQRIGVSKVTLAVRGLGTALNYLPIAAVSAALGVWIGKMIAASTSTARKAAALKRLNAEYKLQLKSIKETRKTLALINKLQRSEHEGLLKLSAGIRTKKDAQLAEIKAAKMLKEQRAKVLALDVRAEGLSEKAKRSRAAYDAETKKGDKFRLASGTDIVLKEEIAAKKRAMIDKIAATRATERFELEQDAHKTMAKTRERITAKLAAFDLASTKKGSMERFEAETKMAFTASRKHQDTMRAKREAMEAFLVAQKGGDSARIKMRIEMANKATEIEKAAAARVKALMKRGQATGMAAMGITDPEEVKKIMSARMRAAAGGVTAPSLELKRELEERRGIRAVGPMAPAPTMSEYIQQPIITMQAELSQRLDKMIEHENEIRKLMVQQPIMVNVHVGGKVLSTTIKGEEDDIVESLGGIVVKAARGVTGAMGGD